MALTSTGSISEPGTGHAPLEGYLTVWAICAVSALVAALCLARLPRPEPHAEAQATTS